MSDMNYIAEDFVHNDLKKIHRKGESIVIDWLTGTFNPANHANDRIIESIQLWRVRLPHDLKVLQVDVSRLQNLVMYWPASSSAQIMQATDDRGKDYTIEITKTR